MIQCSFCKLVLPVSSIQECSHCNKNSCLKCLITHNRVVTFNLVNVKEAVTGKRRGIQC